MSTLLPLHRYTFREYLELEEASNVKHEYLNGEIYGMAGGTPQHAAITMAVGSALVSALRGGPCRAYSSDLRIRVLETGLATYPDITVVCGDLQTDPESSSTITNPTLIVEVLSDSTEEYDRGKKFEHYRQIPSLQDYILISQNKRHVEVHHRTTNGWSAKTFSAKDTIDLPSIQSQLSVEQIYQDALGE